MRKLAIITSMLSLVSCGVNDWQRPSYPDAIYGEDGRIEIYQGSSAQRDAGLSVAALVKKANIVNGRIEAKTLGDKLKLCSDEKFREQPSAAFCSGFLVGSDLLVSSGHCFREADACANTSIVFGFSYNTTDGDPSAFTTVRKLSKRLADKVRKILR